MIIHFETLQKDFSTRSEKLARKKLYTQNELRQIDVFLNQKAYDIRGGHFGETINNYSPEIEILKKIFSVVQYGWSTFTNSYNYYLYNEEEKEFVPFEDDKGAHDTLLVKFNQKHKACHQQGYEFAKYVLWLKRAEDKSVLSKQKSNELTHKQKMLALYYLGLDFRKFQNNVQSAKILSKILDHDYTNTKDYLTYFGGKKSKVKTKANLSQMLELFEHEDFKEIYNAIKEDVTK